MAQLNTPNKNQPHLLALDILNYVVCAAIFVWCVLDGYLWVVHFLHLKYNRQHPSHPKQLWKTWQENAWGILWPTIFDGFIGLDILVLGGALARICFTLRGQTRMRANEKFMAFHITLLLLLAVPTVVAAISYSLGYE